MKLRGLSCLLVTSLLLAAWCVAPSVLTLDAVAAPRIEEREPAFVAVGSADDRLDDDETEYTDETLAGSRSDPEQLALLSAWVSLEPADPLREAEHLPVPPAVRVLPGTRAVILPPSHGPPAHA